MIKFSDVGQKMGWATLVRHQGLVIALAVDIGTNQISYRVLNVKPSVPDDDQNWSGLKQLSFPTQIRPAGMGLVTRDVGEAGTISKGDKAAFRACSDGRYVLVFRPSLDGTMLVDRFVLDPATLMLNPNIETRYQRSRKKDIPAGSKDSMGYEDMENQLFPEPTLELELSREIKGGNFAVILLQTSISSEWRWLIIAGNDSKNQLDFFSIHRASDGLFDMGDVLETNIFLETEGGQIFSPLVGLDALLYAEQESLKDDYGRSQRLKRGLRLMLAAAPQDANFPLAVLDFAVTRDGGLTRVPDESRLTLPELDLDKDEAVLPALYVDIQGTELRGGLLKPAYSKAAPFLMDGTDGLVHLYYPSRQTELQTDTLEEGQFMVAQYDTGTARARIDLPLLPAEKGTAQMTGFRSGAALNDATLTIRAGDDPEHCTVLLACDAGKTQEIWRDVPRRLDRFATVLNGDTTPDVRDPRVEKGEMVAYDAALKRQFISQHLAYLAYDLPAGIGAVRFETWQPVVQEQSGVIIAVSNGSKRDLCTVTLQLKVDPAETAKPVIETWQDVPRGVDDFIRLLSGLFTTDPQDPQVKYGSKLLYDAAAKAKSSDPDVDLRSGSGLFKFQNRGASEQIQNQEIERRAFDHPGSLLFGVVTGISEVDAVLIQVNNVEQALVKEKGSDARWIPEPLGHMLKFSQGSYLDIQQDQLPKRDFQGDLSMEAWVNPGVSSGGVQRILHMQRSEKARCFLGLKQEVKDGKTYFLAHAGSQNLSVLAKDKMENRIHPGVWSHVVAVLNTNNALELDGKGYVDCGNETALHLVDALTVEAWVEPKTVNAAGVIASKWGSTEKDQSWKLSITSEGYPCFSVRDSVNVRIWRLMAKEKIKENVLTHLAGVLDVVPRQETALSLDPAKRQYVYMNGTGLKGGNQPHTIEAWLWLDEYPQKGKRAWILNLGKQSGGTGDHHWLVKSDGSTQLGPWDGVQHTSPLPLKQWTHVALCFDGNQLTCYFNGVQQGAPKQCKFNLGKEKLIIGAHPIPIPLTPFVKADVERYWKGKINNLRVWDKSLSPEQVRENIFKKPSEVTGAVGSWAFDAVDKLLNEVIDKAGRNKGILSGNPDFVEVDKGLYRMQLYVNGICQSWTWLCISEGNLTMGKLLSSSGGKYKVSVIGTWPDLKVGDILMAPDPGGTRGEEQIEVLQLGLPDPISVITLVTKRQVHGTPAFKYVDSQAITITTNANVWVDTPDGDSRKNEFKLAKIADTETKVCIGAEASGTSAFQGLIDEVRIWNLGRSEPQIMAYMNDPLPVDAKGLVAWWSFDEGQDRRAEDLKGTSHGRLIHADEKILKENKLWAPSTRNARWSLYLNGKELEVESQEAQDQAARVDELGGYGDAGQFRLASMASAGDNTSFYLGSLDEVRLWKQVRSPEQVVDNMYHYLDGKEQGLIAYWPMDEGQGDEVADQTGNGQHGKLAGTPEKPTWLRSQAPIGNESPLVRHVYGGLERVFNQVIASQPLAAEYGDLQFDANGELFGVMKRCYIYMAEVEKDIQITSGYKIGDLELHFVGQVQTAPTLVGYIEGAPPVPSENLTAKDPKTDDYVGNSSITLTEATDSVQIYSTSRDTGFDMSVDIKAGLYVADKTSGGLGIQTQIFKAESKFGLHAYVEYSQSWLMGSQISSKASRSQANSLALGGSWEDEKRCLNREVGRRYIPNNMGYALVKSATADLFALRLKRDGSLVAYQVLPNPDIPEDWNIIMFPLNPKYIKNGTLDGMVGLVADPDYPNAVEGERGSYFKPLEAYALKARLDRQAKQREGYYDRYNVWTGENFPEDKDLGYDWAARSSKASLVNTYVWTADGGFFAEETQFSSTKQESKGSASHFLGKLGIYTDFMLAVKVGAFVEADALFGGHINTTLSQTREQTAAFGLSVNVIGEGNLNRWVGDLDRNSGYYTSEPCPGKVDAYRFMTFYLAPEFNHFNNFFSQVVDPNWLYERGPYTGQYLPNARALRQAIANRNEVWRVLHRVTYVSRVPPKFDETAVESKPKDVRRPDNVEGNVALIEEIEGAFYSLYPLEKPELAGIGKLGEAVEKWLDEIQDKTWGKDLDPKSTDEAIRDYRQELRQDILTYLKSYYELDKNDLTGLVEQPTPSPKPVGPSKPLPLWFISSPVPWSQVKGKVLIRGSVQEPKGTAAPHYRLEILGGGLARWKSLNLAGRSPKSGILGSLDTRKLEPGDYRLRLVIDGEGYKPFVVPFRVVK